MDQYPFDLDPVAFTSAFAFPSLVVVAHPFIAYLRYSIEVRITLHQYFILLGLQQVSLLVIVALVPILHEKLQLVVVLAVVVRLELQQILLDSLRP